MKRDGFVLVAVLTMTVLVVVMLVVASTFAVSVRQTTAAEAQKIPAFYLANAGLERAMARITRYLTVSGPLYIGQEPAYVANQVANVLKLSDLRSGSEVAGGQFEVTGTAVPGQGKVELRSTGTATGGATRTVVLSYDIYFVLKSISDSAVSSDGSVVNSGNKMVEGEQGGSTSASGFTISCTQGPGGCQPRDPAQPGYPTGYPLSPVYTVTVTGGTPPRVGDVVTYATYAGGTTVPRAYKVLAADPLGGVMELALIDNSTTGASGTGTTLPLSTGDQLAVTTRGASILSSTNSITTNGNGDTSCIDYACGHLPVRPDRLFQTTFGVTKATFKGALPANRIVQADRCDAATDGVQWLDAPGANGNKLDIDVVPCPDARVLIIQAPAVTGRNSATMNVTLKGGAFRGLLYIIGTHDLTATSATRPTPPGMDVTVTGTDGAFMGAVIVENDVTGGIAYDAAGVPSSRIYTTTLAGTTPGRVASQICPTTTTGGRTDYYNFCYSKPLLAGLKTNLNTAMPTLAVPRVAEATFSWAEQGN
ncbi:MULTISPECIES: hypothetical protein [Deinococcus]|uniref:Type 4 fimbrial biogenesis protein PilX N-terminal domain-containing protein n=1 Tax=Deinococcus rufus TaxID=2136097 RepID=A0ABV7Z4H8_9DEIO|nr:hypothetical protein [Deinococcus sp. AB2017081]WQE95335.1 hypothetical protein U2P90_00200 [Deinococcus sp. AB2017081]